MKPALLLYPHISSFSALLLLAFVAGWIIARWQAPRFQISHRHIDNFCLLLPLAALFGARFFARLFYEKASFLEALKFWGGDGLVFYGGLLFGSLALVLYAFAYRISLVRFVDCVAPSLALGLAFGRIGCFLAGCCWGDLCVPPAQLDSVAQAEARQRVQTFPSISGPTWPAAVQFPAKSAATAQHIKLSLLPAGATGSLPVHPVQLYESTLAFALCILLLFLSRKWRAPGSLALVFLLGYALIRFNTEFLRADNKLAYWGMTFSQVFSLGIGCIALGLIFLRAFSSDLSAPATTAPCKPRPATG